MSINEKLRDKLLAMEREDQELLQELKDSGELGKVDYHPRMMDQHKKNNSRLKQIIGKHGWPGFALVGKEGSKAAWLIAQHGVLKPDFMRGCLAVLKQAVTNEDAEGWCLAYLHDRVLTMATEPQIYGTQHDVDENGVAVPMPIRDPGRVDWLRKGLGMEPLADATKKIEQDWARTIANRDKGQGAK